VVYAHPGLRVALRSALHPGLSPAARRPPGWTTTGDRTTLRRCSGQALRPFDKLRTAPSTLRAPSGQAMTGHAPVANIYRPRRGLTARTSSKSGSVPWPQSLTQAGDISIAGGASPRFARQRISQPRRGDICGTILCRPSGAWILLNSHTTGLPFDNAQDRRRVANICRPLRGLVLVELAYHGLTPVANICRPLRGLTA
jgi:hypothetical protein